MILTVLQNGREIPVRADGGERLSAVLVAAGLSVDSPCGGGGRCGRCRVKFSHNPPAETETDRRLLSENERQDGWRLACTCLLPETDATVMLPTPASWSALSVTADGTDTGGPLGVALDLGTTTLAMAIVDRQSGAVLTAQTAENRGKSAGADVLSRIRAASDNAAKTLSRVMKEDVDSLLKTCLQAANISPSRVQQLVIAANTTMVHLLLGLSVQSLGVAPFTPVTLCPPSAKYRDVIGTETVPATVRFVPAVSAFVGGDIVAGLVATALPETDGRQLLLDLGTNGEMALCEAGTCTVTSVAAGPAFEGGRLSCGVGSVRGAVCRVSLRGHTPQVETIGGDSPIGLCGSGAIEALAAAREAGMVSRSGALAACYPDGWRVADGVTLTAADIRELQMAKAAVRAGAERLLTETGGGAPDRVLLAGGLGVALDPQKAKQIGMLAPEWKTVAAGNTALQGAIALLCEESRFDAAKRIAETARVLDLSTDSRFAKRYIECLDL